MTKLEIAAVTVPPVASLILVLVAFSRNSYDRRKREISDANAQMWEDDNERRRDELDRQRCTIAGLSAELIDARVEIKKLKGTDLKSPEQRLGDAGNL